MGDPRTITEPQFPVMMELFLYKMLLCCYDQTKGCHNQSVWTPLRKHYTPNPGLHTHNIIFGLCPSRKGSFFFSWSVKENMRISLSLKVFFFVCVSRKRPETVYHLLLLVASLVPNTGDAAGKVCDSGFMIPAYQACHHPYTSRVWALSSLLTGADDKYEIVCGKEEEAEDGHLRPVISHWNYMHSQPGMAACFRVTLTSGVFQSEAILWSRKLDFVVNHTSFFSCDPSAPILPPLQKLSRSWLSLWDVVYRRVFRADWVRWHRLLRELRRRQLWKRLPSQVDLPGQRGGGEKTAQDWKRGRSSNCLHGLFIYFLIVSIVIILIATPFSGMWWLLFPSLMVIILPHSEKCAAKETLLPNERMYLAQLQQRLLLKSLWKHSLIVLKTKKAYLWNQGNCITFVGLW